MADGPLSPFDPVDGNPVALVFGTFGYRETVGRWIEAAERGACDHWRIVCLDRGLLGWLRDTGHAGRAVDYYDVLPDAPRVDVDALPPARRLGALCPLRIRLYVRLAGSARDFIASDADAVWLRDPRPWLDRHPDCDLLASQGTTWPTDHYLRHHFALCGGFFLCRAGARTRDYFERMQALAGSPSDQWRLNAVLLRDPGGCWAAGRRTLWLAAGRDWHRPPWWVSAALAPIRLLSAPLLEKLQDRLLLGLGFDYLFTSREVIRGRFSGGLTVGVIPMHLVWRGVGPSAQALVRHDPRGPGARGRRWGRWWLAGLARTSPGGVP